MMIELRLERTGATVYDKILVDPRPCYTSGSIKQYIIDEVWKYVLDAGIENCLISWRGEGSIRWTLFLKNFEDFDGGGGI